MDSDDEYDWVVDPETDPEVIKRRRQALADDMDREIELLELRMIETKRKRDMLVESSRQWLVIPPNIRKTAVRLNNSLAMVSEGSVDASEIINSSQVDKALHELLRRMLVWNRSEGFTSGDLNAALFTAVDDAGRKFGTVHREGVVHSGDDLVAIRQVLALMAQLSRANERYSALDKEVLRLEKEINAKNKQLDKLIKQAEKEIKQRKVTKEELAREKREAEIVRAQLIEERALRESFPDMAEEDARRAVLRARLARGEPISAAQERELGDPGRVQLIADTEFELRRRNEMRRAGLSPDASYKEVVRALGKSGVFENERRRRAAEEVLTLDEASYKTQVARLRKIIAQQQNELRSLERQLNMSQESLALSREREKRATFALRLANVELQNTDIPQRKDLRERVLNAEREAIILRIDLEQLQNELDTERQLKKELEERLLSEEIDAGMPDSVESLQILVRNLREEYKTLRALYETRGDELDGCRDDVERLRDSNTVDIRYPGGGPAPIDQTVNVVALGLAVNTMLEVMSNIDITRDEYSKLLPDSAALSEAVAKISGFVEDNKQNLGVLEEATGRYADVVSDLLRCINSGKVSIAHDGDVPYSGLVFTNDRFISTEDASDELRIAWSALAIVSNRYIDIDMEASEVRGPQWDSREIYNSLSALARRGTRSVGLLRAVGDAVRKNCFGPTGTGDMGFDIDGDTMTLTPRQMRDAIVQVGRIALSYGRLQDVSSSLEGDNERLAQVFNTIRSQSSNDNVRVLRQQLALMLRSVEYVITDLCVDYAKKAKGLTIRFSESEQIAITSDELVSYVTRYANVMRSFNTLMRAAARGNETDERLRQVFGEVRSSMREIPIFDVITRQTFDLFEEYLNVSNELIDCRFELKDCKERAAQLEQPSTRRVDIGNGEENITFDQAIDALRRLYRENRDLDRLVVDLREDQEKLRLCLEREEELIKDSKSEKGRRIFLEIDGSQIAVDVNELAVIYFTVARAFEDARRRLIELQVRFTKLQENCIKSNNKINVLLIDCREELARMQRQYDAVSEIMRTRPLDDEARERMRLGLILLRQRLEECLDESDGGSRRSRRKMSPGMRERIKRAEEENIRIQTEAKDVSVETLIEPRQMQRVPERAPELPQAEVKMPPLERPDEPIPPAPKLGPVVKQEPPIQPQSPPATVIPAIKEEEERRRGPRIPPARQPPTPLVALTRRQQQDRMRIWNDLDTMYVDWQAHTRFDEIDTMLVQGRNYDQIMDILERRQKRYALQVLDNLRKSRVRYSRELVQLNPQGVQRRNDIVRRLPSDWGTYMTQVELDSLVAKNVQYQDITDKINKRREIARGEAGYGPTPQSISQETQLPPPSQQQQQQRRLPSATSEDVKLEQMRRQQQAGTEMAMEIVETSGSKPSTRRLRTMIEMPFWCPKWPGRQILATLGLFVSSAGIGTNARRAVVAGGGGSSITDEFEDSGLAVLYSGALNWSEYSEDEVGDAVSSAARLTYSVTPERLLRVFASALVLCMDPSVTDTSCRVVVPAIGLDVKSRNPDPGAGENIVSELIVAWDDNRMFAEFTGEDSDIFMDGLMFPTRKVNLY